MYRDFKAEAAPRDTAMNSESVSPVAELNPSSLPGNKFASHHDRMQGCELKYGPHQSEFFSLHGDQIVMGVIAPNVHICKRLKCRKKTFLKSLRN